MSGPLGPQAGFDNRHTLNLNKVFIKQKRLKGTLFSSKPTRKENMLSTTVTPPQSNHDAISAKSREADDDAASNLQSMKDAFKTGKFRFFEKNYNKALELFHTAGKYLKDMPRSYPLYAINIRSWIIQTHMCLEDYNITQEYIWETFVMTYHPDVRSTVAPADLEVNAQRYSHIRGTCCTLYYSPKS